ncbi:MULTISPECIES: hypothetical protein [unclassified Luteimonas]
MKTLIAACPLFLLVAACVPQGGNPPDQVATPGDAQLLSVGQITEAEKRAATGDIEAVRDLVAHYVLGEPDRGKAMHWQRVAVGMGDQVMMLNLATYLSLTGAEEDCREADSLVERVSIRNPSNELGDAARRRLQTLRHGFEGAGTCTRWFQ